VGLYHLDDTRQTLVLKAATGSTGRQLLEQGHELPMDERSAIGWCVSRQEPLIMPSDGNELAWFDRPMFDRTQSEIALPLHSRRRILGALSVQSVKESSFGEDDVAVLQGMADQVAVAIDNAQLFAQTNAALKEVQSAHRRYLNQAWNEFLSIRPVTQVDYAQPGMASGNEDLLHEAQHAAMVHERTVATDSAPTDQGGEPFQPQTVLAVPLKLRGQVIGTITMHETRHRRPWTSEDIDLVEAIAEQIAQTVENLRLMDETQRRATRERLVSDVTTRVRETLDMDTVLQAAVREIRTSLNLHDVTIQLRPPEQVRSDDHHQS